MPGPISGSYEVPDEMPLLPPWLCCEWELVAESDRCCHNDRPAADWKCRHCGQHYCTPSADVVPSERECLKRS